LTVKRLFIRFYSLTKNLMSEKSRIAYAIGGHSLDGQESADKIMRAILWASIKREYILDLIVHGSGPQAGKFLDNVDVEQLTRAEFEKLVIECNMNAIDTVGGMLAAGFHTENPKIKAAYRKENGLILGTSWTKETGDQLAVKRGLAGIAVVPTYVEADPKTITEPKKPVGNRTFNQEEVEALQAKDFTVLDVDGKGKRILVPSALIKEVIPSSRERISKLIKLGLIVIGAGVGGTPVLKKDGEIKVVPGVVDKDYALEATLRSLEAEGIRHRLAVILTSCPCMVEDFAKAKKMIANEVGKELYKQNFDLRWVIAEAAGRIKEIKAEDALRLLEAENRVTGGARPKLESLARLVKDRVIEEGYICEDGNLEESFDGGTWMGTKIVP